MAIVVDKEKKRRQIALSCKDLLLKNGIKDITVAQIAKEAKVGKGTIYEYFKNKEDIVFEIMNLFITEHLEHLEAIAKSTLNTKEKIKSFFFLFLDERYKEELLVYKEFIAIALTNGSEEIIEFSKKCHNSFVEISNKIVDEAIKNGELKPEAKIFFKHLHIYHAGLIVKEQEINLDAKEAILELLDSLFKLLER